MRSGVGGVPHPQLKNMLACIERRIVGCLGNVECLPRRLASLIIRHERSCRTPFNIVVRSHKHRSDAMASENNNEHGWKWWLRYIVVPLIGGGGLVAVIVALISHSPLPTPPERQVVAPVVEAQWAMSLQPPAGWSNIRCSCFEPSFLPPIPFGEKAMIEVPNQCTKPVHAFISKAIRSSPPGLTMGARVTVASTSVLKADLSGATAFAIFLRECPN
jgi:hypothetical protein